MNYLTLKNTVRVFLGMGVISVMSSCGGIAYAPQSAPSASAYVMDSSERSLNRNSVSSARRVVVKTGSMNLETRNVRESSERVEQITLAQGGHMLSYDERDDEQKNANFSLRVPAEKLVVTMDEIAQLGKVTYRRITVKDSTSEAIAQQARLAKLKQRRARLEAMYRSATKVEDKLELEETLAEIEEEIFSMEESVKQMQKFAQFSKLDLSLSQKSIRGPVGATWDGAKWSLGKLFTIRE